MPAKRPAPKSAKGKKAASRPAVRKAVGRKAEPVRVRGAVAHARKSVAAPKKPPPAVPATGGEPPGEPRKALRAGAATAPPPATATMMDANRSAAAPPVSADGDDGETIEPRSLLGGARNGPPYIRQRGDTDMKK